MRVISLLLIYLSYVSVLVPIGVFVRWRHQLTLPIFRLLATILALSLISDLCSYVFVRLGFSSIPVVNFYTITEFTIYSLIYAYLLPKASHRILPGTIAFFAFFLADTYLLEDVNEFQSNVLTGEAIFMIVYTILYFSAMFKTLPGPILSRFGFFWINSALFFYFSFDLFLFSASGYIFAHMDPDISSITWSFHIFNNIVKNVLFAYGLYLMVKDRA